MKQHAATLDVTKKAVADPGAFMRALDQTWDVGQHEIRIPGFDHAEVGMKRGERVVRDLRLRRADCREECRFARRSAAR